MKLRRLNKGWLIKMMNNDKRNNEKRNNDKRNNREDNDKTWDKNQDKFNDPVNEGIEARQSEGMSGDKTGGIGDKDKKSWKDKKSKGIDEKENEGMSGEESGDVGKESEGMSGEERGDDDKKNEGFAGAEDSLAEEAEDIFGGQVSDSRIPLKVGSWLTGEGPDKDIVISSRVRLARNLAGKPFPNRAGQRILAEIDEAVGEMLLEFGRTGLACLDLEELSPIERQVLVERHLISRQQSQSLTGRAAYINREQTISIMVNEEDHLRLQFISPGEDLRAGWNQASSYDDLLDERLDFAFDRRYGYLTACPTNLGTGLRASVMLHLPGLSLAGSIKKLLGSIGKFGLTFRGIYGEGSEAEGSIYQLSNQVTLGRSEEEIIDNLESILAQIKDHERRARDELLKNEEYKMKDRIMRAYGVLKHAYQIDSLEAVKLVSLLLLGVYYDLIPLERKKLLELLILTRPAHLQYCCSQEMTAAQRDIKRAEVFRRGLS